MGLAREGAVRISRESIRWTRLVAEGAAIVASILLAFAVDAGWARHQDSLLWEGQLAQLTEELVRNGAEVEASLAASASLEAHLQGLLGVLEEQPNTSTSSIPDSLLAAAFFNPEWTHLQTSVSDALQASGSLALLDRSEVGQWMSRWTVLRRGTVLRQEELRAHFRERLLPTLSSYIEIAPFVAYRNPPMERSGGPGLPWERATGSTDIRNSDALRNVLSERLLLLQAMTRQAKMASDGLETLREVVSSQ